MLLLVAEQTNSWMKFQDSNQTLAHLVELRAATAVPVSQAQRASLNKAGMVFIVTTWEAYVEDVAREAAEHIARHTASYADLPRPLKTIISDGVRRQNNPPWSAADIADDGWRELVTRNAYEKTHQGAFNTPSSTKVRKLFQDTTGLTDVTSSWGWQGFSAPGPAERLDETIEIRGEIVHTGGKPDGLAKGWLDTYGGNVARLVDRTDLAVRAHACEVTGVPMTDPFP